MAFPKPPSSQMAVRLRKAALAVDDAMEARDELIVEALKAGASQRLVGEAIGLTQQRVMQIAHARGWPDAREKNRRAKAKAERDRWRQDVIDYIAAHGRPER